MKYKTAQKLIELSYDTFRKYTILLDEIKETCTKEEFELQRKRTAQLLGILYTDIMLPVFEDYPDLDQTDDN